MVSFTDDPGIASGQDELKSQPTDLSPQEYKQIGGFLDQLAKLISSDQDGQPVSRDHGEQTEESVNGTASNQAESVQLPISAAPDTLSLPLESKEMVVSGTHKELPNRVETQTATALKGLLEQLAPDQTEPETAALKGLLERLAPDQTELETAALAGLLDRLTEQFPPEVLAMPVADAVNLSDLQPINTKLNDKLSQLEAKVDASTQQTQLMLPVMANLLNHTGVKGKVKAGKNKRSIALSGVGLIILGLIVLPWVIYEYFSGEERRLEQKVVQALASAPELNFYRMDADIRGKTLQLTGKLPTRHLRRQAEQIAQAVAPGLALDDDIIVVDGSRDRLLLAAEVQQVAKVLNQIQGISISAHFVEGQVTIEGTALPITTVQNITQAFAQIPGVRSVSNRVKIQPSSIGTRIYFRQNSATVKPIDSYIKVAPIKQLMQSSPSLQIKIIGHSHSTEQAGTQLALERAQTVQAILEDQGIDRRRLQAIGRQSSPPDVAYNQEQWLSRCVLFEIMQPNSEKAQQKSQIPNSKSNET